MKIILLCFVFYFYSFSVFLQACGNEPKALSHKEMNRQKFVKAENVWYLEEESKYYEIISDVMFLKFKKDTPKNDVAAQIDVNTRTKPATHERFK